MKKNIGILRCAYIILFMITYIYQKFKRHICITEIIACMLVIILSISGTLLTIKRKDERGIGEVFVLISIFINGLLFFL